MRAMKILSLPNTIYMETDNNGCISLRMCGLPFADESVNSQQVGCQTIETWRNRRLVISSEYIASFMKFYARCFVINRDKPLCNATVRTLAISPTNLRVFLIECIQLILP